MTPEQLYNCCTDYAEPDWTRFRSLEVGGCTTETKPNGDTWTNGGATDDEAEFWTVYGRLTDGLCEAITDCPTRREVDEAAAELSRLSGLEVLR